MFAVLARYNFVHEGVTSLEVNKVVAAKSCLGIAWHKGALPAVSTLLCSPLECRSTVSVKKSYKTNTPC